MQPKRRVVRSSEVIESTDNKPADDNYPRSNRPISERDRIERLIRLTDNALNPFEDKQERGVSLTESEQRMMNLHTNTLMKLEMSKSALEARAEYGKKNVVELAEMLHKKGVDHEIILKSFNHSRDVEAYLSGIEE
jgi:hypothetical protein